MSISFHHCSVTSQGNYNFRTLLPETGASKKRPPLAETTFARCIIRSGESVAQSTIIFP